MENCTTHYGNTAPAGAYQLVLSLPDVLLTIVNRDLIMNMLSELLRWLVLL